MADINRLIANPYVPDIMGSYNKGVQSHREGLISDIRLQEAKQQQARQNRLLELQKQGATPQQLADQGYVDTATKVLNFRATKSKQEQDNFDREIQLASGLTAGVNDPNEFMQKLQQSGQFDEQKLGLLKALGPKGLSQLMSQITGTGLSADQISFEQSIAGFSEKDKEKARRVRAGLDPRAVGSASQTITSSGTAEDVAETEATIAQRKKFAEATGADRGKIIDKGFEKVQTLDAGMDNIDKAIQAIDDGAQTGPLISRFTPTIREQTKRLEQIKNLMSLDVLNSATFGALSEKELQVVQQTAMPDLPPKELREWLQLRKSGMKKLQSYIYEQIEFIDQGGTPAGFLRMKRKQQAEGQQAPGQQEQPAAQPAEQGGETYEQRRKRLLGL